MVDKRIYCMVDIAKFIFAVCIVILHSYAYIVLPGALPFIIEKGILRLAVPFFFMTSGFFLGKKFKNTNTTCVLIIKSYVKRLFIPFVFWGIVNTVLEIVKLIQTNNGNIVEIVIKHVLFYPYGALWYVYASIVGAVLLIPFLKRNKLDLAIVFGIVLYIFALLCNNYYFVAEYIGINLVIDSYLNMFVSARNGLFVGFLFIGIGIKLANIKKNKASWLLVLTLYVGYLAETLLIRNLNAVDDGALYVMQLCLMPCLILRLTKIKGRISERTSKLCRNLSTGIYFQHRMWLSLITVLGITANVVESAVITIAVSIGVCLVVYKTKNSCLLRLVS